MDREIGWRKLQSKPHLVISSFNNSGESLIKYGSSYSLYDQSNQLKWDEINSGLGAIKANHVGHDLNNILNFIIQNFERLPDRTAFLKANILERHCTREYFDQNIKNLTYTQFYYDPKIELGKENDIIFPGMYLEKNDPWYIRREKHRVFCSLDQLAAELFLDYKPAKYVMFSPGACFMVPKEYITRHPKEIYEILLRISTYDFFPDEAFIVERILPMVFLSGYKTKNNLDSLIQSIETKLEKSEHLCRRKSLSSKISKRLPNVWPSR